MSSYGYKDGALRQFCVDLLKPRGAHDRDFKKQINGDQVNDILTHDIQLSARGMHNKLRWLQEELA